MEKTLRKINFFLIGSVLRYISSARLGFSKRKNFQGFLSFVNFTCGEDGLIEIKSVNFCYDMHAHTVKRAYQGSSSLSVPRLTICLVACKNAHKILLYLWIT